MLVCKHNRCKHQFAVKNKTLNSPQKSVSMVHGKSNQKIYHRYNELL